MIIKGLGLGSQPDIEPLLLGLTAGVFIYISLVDIVSFLYGEIEYYLLFFLFAQSLSVCSPCHSSVCLTVVSFSVLFLFSCMSIFYSHSYIQTNLHTNNQTNKQKKKKNTNTNTHKHSYAHVHACTHAHILSAS